ncbi:hypothetical protein [Pseudokineococcus lusitanus]|uniref:Uncharacterized protein n=1 Tax=Pseudokineococcus lusitanus TaxID=763993 RepID=A0A3N1HQD5_9ACTN|nr:hypothetical protein [Pseudokineococcus lusitanus]ROP44656.1 hypothetical protein EDC03_0782 [Pseudokineococcus lusitanus]
MADLAYVLLTLAAFAALLGLVRLLDGDAPVTDPAPAADGAADVATPADRPTAGASR